MANPYREDFYGSVQQFCTDKCNMTLTCLVVCQMWSQVKLTLHQAQVDDLNLCLSQLGLVQGACTLVDTLHGRSPSSLHAGIIECIVFLSHSAGWCRLAAGLLFLIGELSDTSAGSELSLAELLASRDPVDAKKTVLTQDLA